MAAQDAARNHHFPTLGHEKTICPKAHWHLGSAANQLMLGYWCKNGCGGPATVLGVELQGWGGGLAPCLCQRVGPYPLFSPTNGLP